MDINNNQQTNTFIKGMDTDTSDMYIGEGSYRYAENLRVVTNTDSNSGELHMIEGTKRLTENEELLLGFTSIRDYIVTIVKAGDTWTIYKSYFDEYDALKRNKVAGPFSESIWPDGWDGKTKPLSLVTRWEANDNIKLYIANEKTDLLVINIAEDYGDKSFEEVFQKSKELLLPIKAKVTNRTGASIPGVVIQYGYVIYKVNGTASSLSMLSNVVSEDISSTKGYESATNSTKVIELTLPEQVRNKYVRIYRVAYSKAGELPRVDIIYDQKCSLLDVLDSGQSLQNMASAEFVATNKLLFVPREIESKGDYLFAANVKYSQDEIDAQFDDFDARCYSAGSHYTNANGNDVEIGNNASDAMLSSIEKTADLKHYQFDIAGTEYNPAYWKSREGAGGFINGHGLCFDWRYKYTTKHLSFTLQYGDSLTPKTYGRNEVYRFGVRLFDKDGNVSSVKWIADIKMPDYFNGSSDNTMKDYIARASDANGIDTNSISIEFIPRNVEEKYWENVAKYEIVQAKRTIEDSYKIAQGIYGYPMLVDDKQLCLPYFLSNSPFRVRSGLLYDDYVGVSTKLFWNHISTYDNDSKTLIFASPEYTYQPDDIQNIINAKTSDIYHKLICLFTRDANTTNYSAHIESDIYLNAQRTNPEYAPYSYDNWSSASVDILDYANHSLAVKGTDLPIQYGQNDNGSYSYFLSSQVMGFSHIYGITNREPLGGRGNYGAWKYVYFTNMYPNHVWASYGLRNTIKNFDFIEAQSSDNLASNKWPTYKNQFKTLHNDKKFFNWTNPKFLSDGAYDTFTHGDTVTEESWTDTTEVAADSRKITWKDSWRIWSGDVTGYSKSNGLIGSAALAFPISTGGPSIMLEFDENIDQAYTSGNDIMPGIPIANIIKAATPYGGYSISAINNTQYISQGRVASPSDGALTVSMGDNYITMFVYCLSHAFDNASHNAIPTSVTQYIVPIESTIDLSKQCSNYIQAINPDLSVENRGNGVWVQAKPSSVAGRFIQTTGMYMYNTAYSVLPDVITYSGQDTVNTASPLYDTRIHYSLKKQNNELIDNWTTFKAVDYLDVDSRYGRITGLKLFKDKLVFLQEKGAGILSVNDRTIIKDASSANIILGSGGVLDRYDYFTTIYGMKPDQHVVEASNDALYWWDSTHKEIISYTDGYNIGLLQRIKNVANYINTGTESKVPSIVYDVNNKEVLFNVVNDKSLVYNEQIQRFTSVYTFNPIYYCNVLDKTVMASFNDFTKQSLLYEYGVSVDNSVSLFDSTTTLPRLKYVVNKDATYNKVFDIQTIGGRFYGGSEVEDGEHNNRPLHVLHFNYSTPLKQHSYTTGDSVTNREYDYRLAIPRNNNDMYGGRMRGKTIECEINSASNNPDFSIQYITTKYRMSWT